MTIVVAGFRYPALIADVSSGPLPWANRRPLVGSSVRPRFGLLRRLDQVQTNCLLDLDFSKDCTSAVGSNHERIRPWWIWPSTCMLTRERLSMRLASTRKKIVMKNMGDLDGSVLTMIQATSRHKGNGKPIRCSYCLNWKPDRAHHCRDNGRCVRRTDHFCPWSVYRHVSHTNFLNYMQFLLHF